MGTLTFLVFAAHPDDAERHMGGTIAHLISCGYQGTMVSLTRGQMGTYGDPEIRTKEFQVAATILGVDSIIMDFIDASIQDDYEGRLKISNVICQQKPDIVFAPYPGRGECIHGIHAHPDHYTTGELVTKAITLAAITKINPSAPHWVVQLLYYFLPQGIEPNILVALSNQEMKIALQAVDAHVSQKQAYKGNVPLAEYLVSLRQSPHRKMGVRLPEGCDLSEGFKLGSPITVRGKMLENLFDGD